MQVPTNADSRFAKQFREATQKQNEQQERIKRLERCLGFFASVIKSGEPWTATCQQEYEAAMSIRKEAEAS